MCLTFIITQYYNHSILFSIIVHFSLGLVHIKLIIKITHRKKTKQNSVSETPCCGVSGVQACR